MSEKRELSTLLKYVYFAALSIDDIAGSPPKFPSLPSRVYRHLKRILTGIRLVTHVAYAANSRSGYERADGFDLKWHMGKAGYFGETVDHFISNSHQPDIKANVKHNAIPNVIAHINDCLWTERAPTTAV